MPVPATGQNPSISTNFALDPSTACPEVLSSSSAGTLPVGASCNLAIDFIPTTTGPLTGSTTLTDNNGNVSLATQSIALAGDGDVTNRIQPSVTVTPSAYSLTTLHSLTVTVPVSGGYGNPQPTGMVTLSVSCASATTKDFQAKETIISDFVVNRNDIRL